MNDDFLLRLVIVGAILFAILSFVTGESTDQCDGYYASYDHATTECVPYAD